MTTMKQNDAAPADYGTRVVLPWPPSANLLWRSPTSGPLKGRILMSAKARRYKDNARLIMEELGVAFIPGPVAVQLTARPPDNKRRDLDNHIKIVLDSLKGLVFEDDHDRIIRRISIERGETDAEGGCIAALVTPYAPETE